MKSIIPRISALFFSTLCLGLSMMASPANATPSSSQYSSPFTITSLYSTGLRSDGTPLSIGETDPHYSLIQYLGYDAYGVDVDAKAYEGSWDYVHGQDSRWISSVSSGDSDSGWYVYSTTFDLTGFDVSSAHIDGSIAADDSVWVFFNYNFAFSLYSYFGNSPWTYFTDFSISDYFVEGINRFDFIVLNDGGPTGLNVEMSGTAIPYFMIATGIATDPPVVPEMDLANGVAPLTLLLGMLAVMNGRGRCGSLRRGV